MGKRLGRWVIAAALAASTLDVIATYVAMRTGVGFERNPVAAAFMGAVGVGTALAVGLLLRVALVGLLALIGFAARHHVARRTASAVLVSVAVWWCLVAVNAVGVVVSTRG
jgi:hypothetical protein